VVNKLCKTRRSDTLRLRLVRRRFSHLGAPDGASSVKLAPLASAGLSMRAAHEARAPTRRSADEAKRKPFSFAP
jgi:hypothetical protein